MLKLIHPMAYFGFQKGSIPSPPLASLQYSQYSVVEMLVFRSRRIFLEVLLNFGEAEAFAYFHICFLQINGAWPNWPTSRRKYASDAICCVCIGSNKRRWMAGGGKRIFWTMELPELCRSSGWQEGTAASTYEQWEFVLRLQAAVQCCTVGVGRRALPLFVHRCRRKR